ncbi:hypothetical protein PG985_012006 [Apiospora marii]|uniref:Stc1 domain-containing protein n=1 Tax=Apiospora marii TaxID=335849 RepID=A0ABR1RFM8_9PEZI
MAKGATLVPNPSTKRQKPRKSTGPVDQQGQSQTQATKQHLFGRLLEAERDCNDKFACWNCLTLKRFYEFESEQAIKVRRMDLPECPVEQLRRVCIECGIDIGLYRAGHVLKRNEGADCWICDCPSAHKRDGSLAGTESYQCHDCGMTQCFSTPAANQNRQDDVVPIYPLPPQRRPRSNNRFTPVADIDARPSPAQVRKTSIPYLLCPTSTPVLLSPPYQHSELVVRLATTTDRKQAGCPESEESEQGVWSPM